ncbi:hypothetical protein [Dactylosporangium sp. CA-233914]|uniref:hypothetical protein n=1 Tax=Dactylosporangium sp. CA-233914 TaxID=3239934 RepID=UPI003D8E39D0
MCALALAFLGATVLLSAVRYDGSPGRTALADGGPAAPHPPSDLPMPSDAGSTGAGSPGVPTSSATLGSPRAPATTAGSPTQASTPALVDSPPLTVAPGPSLIPQFSPVSVQAEHPANVLSDGARIAGCDTCDGGARVRYLGTVTAYLDIPTAGERTVTVTYEIDGHRRIKVAVNNATPLTFTVTGTSWHVPLSFEFTAAIPAGRTAITFYNDNGPAPDIDKVTVR